MMSKRKQLSGLDPGQQKRAKTPTPRCSPAPPVNMIATVPHGAGLAFRISNIPSHITSAHFLHILDRLPHDGSVGAVLGDGGQQNIIGWSFAPAAASADTARYRTATVTFKSIPTLLQFPDNSSSIDIDRDTRCIVDKHFHGLTPLNFPVQPTVDIIAVTGLAGHAFGSWKSRGGSEMWLRDFLPEHVPNTRILTYGYDSTLFKNNSTALIQEYARNFLQALNSARVGIASRPLVFIGHSLGGILIKEAIIQAPESNGQNLSIYNSCYGLLLFGAPNLGLEVTSLRSMVKGQPNSQLIKDLASNSDFLRRQKFFWDFQIPDATLVISIYETKPTPTVQETFGVWKQNGPKVLMVSKESAIAATPVANQDNIFSIDQDHSNIAKFKNRACSDYIIVCAKVISLVQHAPSVICKRLADLKEPPQMLVSGDRVNNNIRSSFMEFRGQSLGEKRIKILQWLSGIEYLKHHLHALDGILDDTGRWLRDSWQFNQWRTSNQSSILWLHGIPGAGKTKLTCMIIETLRSSVRKNRHSSYRTHEPVIYFYCNRNEPDRRDPKKIMQAIVKQLSLVLPPAGLPKPVVAAYEERVKVGFASGPLEFEESKDLLVSLLHIFPDTTIIIDALDESDPSTRGRLLDTLTALMHSSTSSVKIFISSRDDIDIKLKLENVPNLYVEAQSSGDIERFIRREIAESPENRRLRNLPDVVRQQVVDTLVDKAGGMFQWVNLQLKHLAGMKFEQDIIDNLGKLPRSLRDTYSQVLTTMRECPNGKEWLLARRALMWIICSADPLNENVWTVMTFWPMPVPEDGPEILFEICQNLVTLDSQSMVVRFAHLSVQEYLESDREFTDVAANLSFGAKVMSMLLATDDTNISITEAVFVAVVGNWGCGAQVTSMLLATDDTNFSITEAVLKAAAGNVFSGAEVMPILLATACNISITEAVLKAAAGNVFSGAEIMSMLLATDDTNISITEAVLVAATGNSIFRRSILLVLLACAVQIPISRSVVAASASGSPGDLALRHLLFPIIGPIQITKKLVDTALDHWGVVSLDVRKTVNESLLARD